VSGDVVDDSSEEVGVGKTELVVAGGVSECI
jgi:hypothetical protein